MVLEELNVYIQNVQTDLETFVKKKKNDKGDLMAETQKTLKKILGMNEDV